MLDAKANKKVDVIFVEYDYRDSIADVLFYTSVIEG